MLRFSRYFTLIMCAFTLAFLGTSDVSFAKGSRSSSSSRSSGSSWGGSKSSSSSSKKSSSWGGSKTSNSNKSSNSSWGGNKTSQQKSAKPAVTKDPLTGKQRSTSADKAAYEKAKASGKTFTDVKSAKSSFTSKAKSDPATQKALSQSYPTSFNTRPSTRPDYIPQTYQGRQVVYDSSIGGYGYRNDSGVMTALASYMLVDTMTDAMMMNAMSRQGYYVGSPPVVHSSSGGGIIGIILFGCCAVIIVFIILAIVLN